MPFFTVTSPSGRQYDIDATSEDHANDYVARRFFSGMEASGNSVGEPDARLIGPFGPPPKQQRPSWQDFVETLDPPAPTPEDPAPSSPFQPHPSPRLGPTQPPRQPTPPASSMTNRLALAAAMRLKRLRSATRFSNYLRGF